MRIFRKKSIFTMGLVGKKMPTFSCCHLIALTITLCIFWSEIAHAKTIKGKVVGVHDGDTITVLQNKTPYKIRLIGIDTPELGQPFGRTAKWFVSDMAFDQTVEVDVKGRDRYKRYLGIVVLPGHINLNQALLANGLAWHYRFYSKDSYLQSLEDAAKQSKLGLWRLKNPTAPWDYRHKRKAKKKGKK